MNRRRLLTTGAALAAGGVGIGAYARFVETERIEFTHHALAAGWPAFAQISDLHLHDIGRMHAAIADELARSALSFLLITGDSIDRKEDLVVLDEFLSTLPPLPKFAILGNWEHWCQVNPRELARVYERWNGLLLVNTSADHQGVRLVGLDDLIGGKPDLSAALAAPDRPSMQLLLAHCPAHRDSLPRQELFDLVLSGHTHGGQIQLFGFAPLTPDGSGSYVEGWYRGTAPMYVSRGVGTTALPVRLGCRPEVAFFTPPA